MHGEAGVVSEGLATPPERRMGLPATLSLVVASMIGTGVFTTTGYLVDDIPSAGGLLLCWAVAGIAALCGALCYAELGTAMPHIGGEYRFLSELVHPVVGFTSAFVSLIVGFSAPLAALALAFGSYLQALVPAVHPVASAAALVVVMSALNAWRVSAGASAHTAFTVIKVLLVAGFAVVGVVSGDAAGLSVGAPVGEVVTQPGFAVGLIWVSFSYTGWNAAAYVAGEVATPERTLPQALLIGTLLVTALYVGLNAAFLMAAPLDDLRGKAEVGHIAATALLGPVGGKIMSGIIAAGLVSTVGALVVTGPRVYEAVGRDFPLLARLSHRRGDSGPVYAVGLQAALALAFMAKASLRELLGYIGFTLSLFAALTVACVFLLRRRGIRAPFQTWGYPVTPLVFLALMAWMIVAAIQKEPEVLLAAGVTFAVALVLYRVVGVSSS